MGEHPFHSFFFAHKLYCSGALSPKSRISYAPSELGNLIGIIHL